MVTGTPPRIDLGSIVAEVKRAFVADVTGETAAAGETPGAEAPGAGGADATGDGGGNGDTGAAGETPGGDAPGAGGADAGDGGGTGEPPPLALRGFTYETSWALRETVDGKIDVVVLELGGEASRTLGQRIKFHLCRTENQRNCVP